MIDRVIASVRRVVGRVNRGIVIFGALLAALAAATELDLKLGIIGPLAVVVTLGLFYCAGLVSDFVDRRRRRQEAFYRRDNPEQSLDPIADCRVHPWLGQEIDDALPEFVERGEWDLLRIGLRERQFVLLTGKGICGKSRLAYEACSRLGQVTLVARDPPSVSEDSLRLLMEDHHGFPAREDRQILLLNDVARRLRSGCLNAQLVRGWLERNPTMWLIAIQTARDEKEIAEGGEALERGLEDLIAEARVVEVRANLDRGDRRKAKRAFPDLEERDLEILPHYLASGPPLREAIEYARRGRNDAGMAVVRVVADWHRAGVTIPVPLRFLEEHTNRLADIPAGPEFDDGLAWALDPVKGEAALVYERSTPGGPGYVPDSTVIKVFNHPAEGASVLPLIWQNAMHTLRQMASSGEYSDGEMARELVSLGEAAFHAGQEWTGKRAFEVASSLDPVVEPRIGDFVVEDTENTLVRSRRGDGVFQRLQPVEQLTEGRRRRSSPHPLSGGSSNALGWIYRRNWLRSVARTSLLAASDLASVGLGLLASFEIRSWLADSAATAQALRSSSVANVGITALVVLCVFARAGLYEKDAMRARIGAIASALSVLTVFGWIALIATGLDILVAAAAVVCGGFICLGLDLICRSAYDHYSRNWVAANSPEARTLVVGSPGSVAELEKVLKDFSRPMDVIGYLEDGKDHVGEPAGVPVAPCLGGIEDLGDVAQRLSIGRVILADSTMDMDRRQRLADRCHERHLLVEARASLSDIRSGLSRFVLGQPVLLVPLWPLWPRNVWAIVKRVVDVCLSLLLLGFLAIPMGIIAIGIRVQGGPVIVRTLRLGLGGRRFHMLRFRTRKGDSGGIEILEPDEASESSERIWMGTLLDRSGADELPQLFNVLRGQMSLVGPRPLDLRHHIHLDDPQLQRYLVRPGATGPWQVSRQTRLTYDQLTALDIGYLRHWTIFSDFEILARTFLLMLTRRTVPKIVGHSEAFEEGVATEDGTP